MTPLSGLYSVGPSDLTGAILLTGSRCGVGNNQDSDQQIGCTWLLKASRRLMQRHAGYFVPRQARLLKCMYLIRKTITR